MEFAACLTLSMTNLLRSFAESLLHISRSKQSAIEKYNASRRPIKMPSRTSSYKRRYSRTSIFSGLPIRKLGQAGTPFACTFCLRQNMGERHTINSYNLHNNRSPPLCKTSLSAPPPTHTKKKNLIMPLKLHFQAPVDVRVVMNALPPQSAPPSTLLYGFLR